MTKTDNEWKMHVNSDHTPTDASSRPGAQWPAHPLQLCAACCVDWQSDATTLLCRTCRAVDDLLAQRAGAAHFLPHIISRTRDGQPQRVMTCALHSARFPTDTGFYGIYTTMSGLLSAAGRERRAAVGKTLRGGVSTGSLASDVGQTTVLPTSILAQPSHSGSLIAIADLVEAHFACARAWLAAHLANATKTCREQDTQHITSRSDFNTAQLTTTLTRTENHD